MRAREREAAEREERELHSPRKRQVQEREMPDQEETSSLKPSSYPRLEVSPLDSSTLSPYPRPVSTLESEAFFSPDLDRTPVPRQRMFTGIPRAADRGVLGGRLRSSASQDSDTTEQSNGGVGISQRQSSFLWDRDALTPTPKRKRPVVETEGVGLDDSDSDEPIQSVERSQRDKAPATPTRRGTRIGPDGLPTPQRTKNRLLIASESASKRRKIGTALPGPSSPTTPSRSRNLPADDSNSNWDCLLDEVEVIRDDLKLIEERRRSDREDLREELRLLRRQLVAQTRKMDELQRLVASLQGGQLA
ncbi:hypothetical protein N656DRAFT_795125 [Canariomyces notabilis]|uniref:Uncharacterized protein n=1 Tax=Canariomyces notabilis TaxID=2074819 RepID=A0AAN6TLU9_9PEZI|nr:hypothetical protein N656DRAFT_795125 [Canariomyces arenarius]